MRLLPGPGPGRGRRDSPAAVPAPIPALIPVLIPIPSPIPVPVPVPQRPLVEERRKEAPPQPERATSWPRPLPYATHTASGHALSGVTWLRRARVGREGAGGAIFVEGGRGSRAGTGTGERGQGRPRAWPSQRGPEAGRAAPCGAGGRAQAPLSPAPRPRTSLLPNRPRAGRPERKPCVLRTESFHS